MKRRTWWFGSKKPQAESFTDEKLKLYREICQAHEDWKVAHQKIHYVKENEQIDYIIYLQEAAEKRYEMLLRQAKRMNLNVMELYQDIGKRSLHSGKAMEG